jgi:hypothetical protein
MAVSTLADDLDREMGQRPLIGVVGTDPADRIAIGGFFYVASDRDTAVFDKGGARSATGSALDALRLRGFGADRIPDLLAVVLHDSIVRDDTATRVILRAARRVAHGSVLAVVTGTGSTRPSARQVTTAAQVVKEVEQRLEAGHVVDFAGPGGLFLEQTQGTRVSAGAVARALRRLTGPGGGPIMVDAFPGFAVALARFC